MISNKDKHKYYKLPVNNEFFEENVEDVENELIILSRIEDALYQSLFINEFEGFLV